MMPSVTARRACLGRRAEYSLPSSVSSNRLAQRLTDGVLPWGKDEAAGAGAGAGGAVDALGPAGALPSSRAASSASSRASSALSIAVSRSASTEELLSLLFRR